MATNYEDTTIGCDATFELNEFHEAKISPEIEVVANTLLTVLYMKPGQYPSIPQLGLDIESLLYEHFDDIDIQTLYQQIRDQCSMLGMYINDGTIQIVKAYYHGQPSLLINVEGDAEYPEAYKHDDVGDSNKYMIGITFDEANRMISNINKSA